MAKNKQLNNAFAATDKLRQLGWHLTDIVLPPQPLFRPQRADVSSGGAQNWADVRFLDEPCCESCGFPFDFHMPDLAKDGPSSCGRCAARAPAYDRARAAFAYDNASRSLVLRFKHGGETEGVAMFASQMQRAGRKLMEDAELIIPVPLHRRRLLKRRFNQSALLARAISKQSGIVMDTDSLLRSRHTPSQGGQSYAGRRRNVSGAFVTAPGAQLGGKHVLLIDDVMTTGATLESCARTLKRAGAKGVDAIVLSRVVKPAAVTT